MIHIDWLSVLTADEIDALTEALDAYDADADSSWRDSLREEVECGSTPQRQCGQAP